MLNQILKIENKSINQEVVNTINARNLWEFLESKRNFADWIKDRLQDFIENEDFILISQNYEIKGKGGDRRSKDYFLTIDTAKHLAMLERNKKGKQARNYFIQIEKEYKNNLKLQNQNNVKKIGINEIDLKDFNNYQYFYMNDVLLSFPYFRYKINQDTGLPLINIDDYVKCVGFRSYSLYLLEKDNKNKETIEFKKIYDITCNKLMKEYLEDFRERFKKASELKILEDLNNPCIIEDEREYNSTLYIEDYKNLIGTERLYTATEIGSVLGISSLMVGKIANKLKLKNEKFGAWFKDKASHSIKEVQTFKYNKNVINELKEYLKLNNTNTLTI